MTRMLRRYEGNPILSPKLDRPWECLVTTNPAAWYDEDQRKVLLLYRAAGDDDEHRIHLGLAESQDGYAFRRVGNEPVFSPSADGFDAGCVEDPRLVKIDEYYYMTYAARPFPPRKYWLPEYAPYYIPPAPDEWPIALRKNLTSTGLAITEDFLHFIRAGRITEPTQDDRDVLLFPERIGGRYVRISRPKTPEGDPVGGEIDPTIYISFSEDMLYWPQPKPLIRAQFEWERKLGAASPPIRTKEGWLMLYHAVGDDNQYRIGAMLLELNDPARVLHRRAEWLLQPEAPYELQGFYNGVVFPCGNVVIEGTLFVYYGGADKYCCLATCRLEDLLADLRTCPA